MLGRRSNGWLAWCCMTLSFGVIFLLMLLSTAYGRPFRLGKVPGRYGCGTCHIATRGGGPRTPFGSDWERIAIKAGETMTDELKALDSDGDGFTNQEEFEAGTHPGRASSKPEE